MSSSSCAMVYNNNNVLKNMDKIALISSSSIFHAKDKNNFSLLPLVHPLMLVHAECCCSFVLMIILCIFVYIYIYSFFFYYYQQYHWSYILVYLNTNGNTHTHTHWTIWIVKIYCLNFAEFLNTNIRNNVARALARP